MARKQKTKGPTPVEATKHKDQRVNIPTQELRQFVEEAEEKPSTLLYPRDPSLDPQLVWKGKDEQDRKGLSVPAVPVYIQEKIHPQALIENLRDTAKAGEPEPEQLLFADFNGLDRDFDRKIDFYSHDLGSQPKWSNRMILGDSLLVMASLAEKEGLKGKVQMIYLDPPYGIKFGSNWQVSTRKRDVKDGKVEDLAREPEVVKAFRDTWELGIHSYLAYLRDRLVVARELLTETGSIFVQIGDENVHLVRSLLDEVLGSDNFVAQIVYQKTPYATSNYLAPVCDLLLWYGREHGALRYRELYLGKSAERIAASYRYKADDLSASETFASVSLVSPGPASASQRFFFERQSYLPPANSHWKTTLAGLERTGRAGRLFRAVGSLRFRSYPKDLPISILHNIWTDTITGSFTEEKKFIVQTNPTVVERCLLMTTDPGDLVLDPTCGSGTTATVAEQWGRRWITIDTSRVALALARARLMAAKFPYYHLADSADGRAKEAAITGTTAALSDPTAPQGDVKRGFVYQRVPHVTLKSIANNEEIDALWDRFQSQLEPLRAKLNTAVAKTWEEWEIPREADAKWPAAAKKVQEDWWRLRRERQTEIDASIARRADTELLYDKPYEDGKRIRVTGPFTVESLSPHRVLSTDEERPASEADAAKGQGSGRFETTILDNLRKAGVQNTKRDERLTFSRLETFAGRWIQAAGDYTDAAGTPRRVAISIGPEHGTVGPTQIQEAAKEAVRGIPFDLLLVLGFAFDAHAAETAREISPENLKIEEGFIAEHEAQFGKLPVLLVRMNPDLAMGDDLLKKTGAGNLFMVFGEPDVSIETLPDGNLTVEIRGLDVYDPTTGTIRSSSTDDIACWFLDTDYDEESFFVRHAYFCGAEFDDAYDRLKRALRAEIDETAWASLYTTTSRPFSAPASGKIAVKVINHYGDEVLHVYEVAAHAGSLSAVAT